MADLNAVHARFRAQATDDRLDMFAYALGVSPRALRSLECGFASPNDMRGLGVGFAEGAIPDIALTIPERGADGGIVGFCFRSIDDRKGTARGTKRGIAYSVRKDKVPPSLLVEGASDTAAAESMLISAIGRPSGRGGNEIVAAVPNLADRDPIVIADADPTGVLGATALAKHLANRWKRPVPWVQLPNGAKDLREYLNSLNLNLNDEDRLAAAGERLVEILRANATVVQPETLTTCLADIETKPLRWLARPLVPLGKLCILSGPPGLGKSAITVDVGARLTRGRGLDGEQPPDEPGDVLFLSAEDDPADTIRPRCEAAGADLNRVHVSKCLDLDELGKMLDERPNVRLVVIDPLSAYVGHIDAHRDADVRTLLARFAELAAERGVAILFVSHLKKSGEGDAVNRPGGSIAFVAASRVAWIVLKDMRDEQRRLLLPIKCNIGPDVQGFAYRVTADGPEAPPRIAWEPERVKETADKILSRAHLRGERAGRGEATDQACEFLREFLKDGPQPYADLFEAAKANGIGRPSLKRAKKKLGVIAEKATGKLDGGWIWRLPPDAEGSEPAEGDHVSSRDRHEPLREERDDDEGSSFDLG